MSDLEDAKEALDTLGNVLPLLPGQMEAVVGQAAALESRVEGLLRQVEERRTQAAELLERLRAALDGLGDDAEGRRDALRDAAREVDQGLEALAAAEQAHSAVAAAVQETVQAMDALEQRLTEGAGEIAAQRAAASQALDTLEASLDAGQETVASAADAVADEASALQQAADEAQDAVNEASDMLRQQMHGYAQRAEERMQAAQQMAHELEAEQMTAVDAALGVVAEQQDELQERLKQEVESAVEEALTGAVREAATASEALAETLAAAAAALLEDREAVAPLIESCGETVEPVQEMLANVREAAAQTGLTW
jgi:chromosome segregation ATPase